MKYSWNRRQFIATGVGAGPLLLTTNRALPSERVRIGFIACGGRARQLIKIFRQFNDVDIPVICDVIEPRMDEAMKILEETGIVSLPEKVVEHERILERNDVDAVVIATTQHWHGLPFIQACQAGKAIFVEKPLSHTVAEGRAMVKAAQKYGVLALMGTQQRAGEHYQRAVDLIQSGRLGKVALVECWNYHNTGNRAGKAADSNAPKWVHWDRWLGPAPTVAYNPARLVHEWWFDYGGGMMTNWAIHHIDIILWAMNASSPKSVVHTGGKYVIEDLSDTPDTIEATWEFENFLMHYTYRGFNNFHTVFPRPQHHGICFHGNKATLVLDRFGYQVWDDGNPNQAVESEPRSEQDGPWQRAFVDCIKEKRKPPLDLEMSHKGSVCCQLANISHFVKRRIRWDGEREAILEDSEASVLLDRPRRPGYELPMIS